MLGTYFDGPARFEILVRGGRLAVQLPQQIVVPLEGPDASGRWCFEFDPRTSISFVRGEEGEVTAFDLDQAGNVVRILRGEDQPAVAVDLEAVKKYLGVYHDPEGKVDVEILIHKGHLAVKSPLAPAVMEFITPEGHDRWLLRANPSTWITFQEDASGTVVSYTAHVPGRGAFVRPRVLEERQEGQGG
ncbi:MAG: hypothetical protein V2A76_16060 [Planctomycetota bacterium]